MVKCILLDIEGTTSSISFVKEVLFPYAREALPDFLTQAWDHPEVIEVCEQLREMTDEKLHSANKVATLLQTWIDEDRKATPLKSLQGMIWKKGYEEGDYKAHLYPDVVSNLREWKKSGFELAVYSSGSVAAQHLFFQYSEQGDIREFFSQYFDTTIGSKMEVTSYQKIAEHLTLKTEEVLFLSDNLAELDAALEAGMLTCCLQRDLFVETDHPVADDFDEVSKLNLFGKD